MKLGRLELTLRDKMWRSVKLLINLPSVIAMMLKIGNTVFKCQVVADLELQGS